MGTFTFTRLDIPDVILVEPKVFTDERGFFMEDYKYSEFCAFGINDRFVQDNHSKSKKGTLRGLHYQKQPKAQAKIVRCIRGKIFDVAVDIRPSSSTFSHWVAEVLSAENKRQLYVPVGFAHGFCALDDDTEIVYKCSEEYSPKDERGIIWNDETIGVRWPLLRGECIVSEKDARNPILADADIS